MKSGLLFNLVQEGFSRAYGWASRTDPYPLRTLVEAKYEQWRPHRVLDIGCGSGCYALGGVDYVGVDLNRGYLRYCLDHRQGVFACARGEALPFGNRTFDAVLCFSVGHHLDDVALRGTLSEASRVLTPDGWLLFADVVRPIHRWPALAATLEWLDEGRAFRREDEYDHLLSKRFEVESRQEIVDQFYRTMVWQGRAT